MRFCYIKYNKQVTIDGHYYEIPDLEFDPEVDAIQWYDTWGEIEYINRQERSNEKFEDISYIQPLIDLWNVEKTKQDQLITETSQQQNILSIESDNQKLLDMINS